MDISGVQQLESCCKCRFAYLQNEIKSSIIKENDIMKCNFEIIGNIEEDNENDVVGLDYLSQNAFAKMI